MQRELRFRVWDKPEGRMIVTEQDFIPLKVTSIGVLRLDASIADDRWILMPIGQFEIMQFTGLKDKNGVDIYEGDIISIPWVDPTGRLSDDENYKAAVFYKNGAWCHTGYNVKAIHELNENSTEIYATGKESGVCQRNEIQYIGQSVDLRINDTDPDTKRLEEQYFSTEPTLLPEGVSRYFGFGPHAYGNFSRYEIESGIIRMLDGLPEGLDYTERNKRIKALGNAIVPQVAYEIFKAIEQMPLSW